MRARNRAARDSRKSSAVANPIADCAPARTLLAASVALAFVGAACAQSARDSSAPLEDVVVTATRSPAAVLGVPASVSVVTREDLAQRSLVRMGDALADVPGLYVRGAAFGAGFPGSGQAVLSLRGVPRTPRTLVMIDGQPVNNALSGGVNVAGIPLEAVERVEVVRGPYSALYGGAAMGGVVNFITAAPDAPLTELRVGAGSLAARGASFVHRRRHDSGLGVTLSLGYRESGGYPDAEYVVKQSGAGAAGVPVTGARATSTPDGVASYWVGLKGNRPWAQEHAQLALHYDFSAATRVAVGFGAAQYRVGASRPESFLTDASGRPVFAGAASFDDGGARRVALAESDFLTATPSVERDLRLFARVTHRFDAGAVLQANLGALRHRFDFPLGDPGAAFYDHGTGQFSAQPNDRIDLDVALRTPITPSWRLVTGAVLNRSTLNRRTMSLTDWRDAATQTAMLNAGVGSSNGNALFVQSEHYLDHGVTAYLGGRYDRYDTHGVVAQTTAPAFVQDYASRSFGQFSPKLALVWEAREGLALRASYGAGFRAPALLDLYSRTASPGTTAGTISVNEPAPDLKPERVRSFELGADARLPGGGIASFAVYSQKLEDMIYRHRISTTLTRSENAGAADVDGVEASVRWRTPVRGLQAFGAFTHQLRYEITRNDAVPASVGKVLTDVPRTTWSAGLQLARGPWSGLLVVRHVGAVFGSGDDTNRNAVQGVFGSYDAYTVASAKLGYRFDRRVSASLAVDNLTNRQYFVFNRQPGRTVYAELAYRFD